ncbi:MAG: BamA/TamA family outer membrane protein [Flavobacteriaceae bacterium]
MKIYKVKIVLFTLITTLLSSCSISKNLTEGEKILKKNNLFVNDVITQNDSLNNLFLQNKNSTFIGIPVGALIYTASKSNTDSIFDNWLLKKRNKKKLTRLFSEKQVNQIREYYKSFNNWKKDNGEKLVLIDSSKTLESAKNLNSYFQNIGYLDNRVSFEIEDDKTKSFFADINYKVSTGPQYYVGDVNSIIESKIIDSIYKKNIDKSFLIKNQIFRTKNFEFERDRLNRLFKNSGIYNFQINSILFDVEIDSAKNVYSLPIKVIIKDDNYKVHKIDKISVKSLKEVESLDLNSDFISNQIKFKTGSVFNDSLRTITLQNFNKLDLFSFPSISYEYLNKSSNSLEANIILNSKKKYGIGFGLDIKQSNIEDIGVSFENRFKTRNIFKNGENLEISASGSLGKSANVTISQINYDLILRFPKFLFLKNNKALKSLDQRSFINLGASNQRNIGLDRNSFKFDLNYSWSKKNNFYNLSLSQVELIKNKNIQNYFNIYSNSYDIINEIAKDYAFNTNYFLNGNLKIPDGIDLFIDDALSIHSLTLSSEDYKQINYLNNRKKRLTTNNLIIGSTFSISNNYETRYDKTNFNQWRIKFQSAGALTNILIGNSKKNNEGLKTISDLPFSQFIKSELSYIKHWTLGDNSTIASRYFLGFAIPYGNSNNIPFSESFFGGGSNDNRAWEVYRLGPGSSGATDEFNEGNLKIAFNFEYRFKMFGRFNGALFTDIGNIWNILDDTEDDRRTFNNLKDLNELAIGSGFGLRYDSGLFVFRLDMGLKTYNPARNKDERWFKDFSLKKSVFNIGLNYPF